MADIVEIKKLGPKQLAWLRENIPNFKELERAWKDSRKPVVRPANDEREEKLK